MMKKGKEYRQFYLFGIMSEVLSFGFYPASNNLEENRDYKPLPFLVCPFNRCYDTILPYKWFITIAYEVLNISFFKSVSDIQKPYRDHHYLHHL